MKHLRHPLASFILLAARHAKRRILKLPMNIPIQIHADINFTSNPQHPQLYFILQNEAFQAPISLLYILGICHAKRRI
jgi:hypothetical protein